MPYLQWPSDIGNSDMNHWIQFQSFVFGPTKEPSLNVALFVPPDALNTAYKSDYESAEIGKMATDFLTNEKASGKEATIADSAWNMLRSAGKKISETQELVSQGLSAISGGAADAALGRYTGKILNPYIVTAYKGPTGMRDHTFTFKMMPKNETDSGKISEIVKEFKNAMLPSHTGGVSENAPMGMFGYPDEFEIDFYINGKKLPKGDEPGNPTPLFKIGRSVLTDITMDYTTQDTVLFFENTQNPVTVEMKLQFTEINVLYRELVDQRGY